MDQSQNTQQLPAVSVIIANYGNAHFVLDAVKSALVQTYPNVGIFITDDCSKDNSVEVVKNFMGVVELLESNDQYELVVCKQFRFPIYLFSLKKNVGRGLVRNISIQYALNLNYHMVQILDADDIMHEEKVSKLSIIMVQDPQNIGLVYADYIIMNEDGVTKYESKRIFDWNIFNREDIIHSGALINSLALKQYGLYPNLSTCEDYHLFRRICKTFIAIHHPEALTIVRSHSLDSTHSINQEEWQRNLQRVFQET